MLIQLELSNKWFSRTQEHKEVLDRPYQMSACPWGAASRRLAGKATMRAMGRLIAVVLLSSLLAPKASPRVALAGEQKTAAVSITVSVAASLKDALTEIAGQFGRTRPDIEIAINSGASGGLELQIEQGAP